MQTISYGQLLRRNRDFRLLWGGQVVSQLGDWFSLITLQSLLLTLTGSASSLAALMIAQMLPLFLLSPAAGVVVDRLPRKHVMIVADLGRAGIALGFLLVRDGETAWLAYGFYALLSSLTVFFEPALTVFCSIIAHGLTDTPGAEWIARRAERGPETRGVTVGEKRAAPSGRSPNRSVRRR